MKRLTYVLMLFLVSINVVWSTSVNEQQSTTTSNSLDTEKSNCLVTLSVDKSSDFQFTNLIICNEDGEQVGSGKYAGSYYVPSDGTITFNWKARYSDDYNYFDYSYKLYVESAQSLEVHIEYVFGVYTYITVGGVKVQTWTLQK